MPEESQEFPQVTKIEYPLRGLCSPVTQNNEIKFLTGTASVSIENKFCLLTVNDENHTLNTDMFSHDKGPICDISCSRHTPYLFSTCHLDSNSECQSKYGYIWKIHETEEGKEDLLCVGNLNDKGWNSSRWNPSHKNLLMGVNKLNLTLYDISDDTQGIKNISSVDTPKQSDGIKGMRWDPHQGSQRFIYYGGGNVYSGDTRSKHLSPLITPVSASNLVLDIDFNPNLPDVIAIAGTDCYIRIYDTKYPKDPLISMKHNTHWVNCVQYNSTHDQLITTSSGDGRVSLLYLPTHSSLKVMKGATAISESQEMHELGLAEGLVDQCETHTDSAGYVSFSSADSWIYASISYFGLVVVHQVPENVKINVLL